MAVSELIQRGARSGQAIRVYLTDGEEIVARVLNHDEDQLVYLVETSTHPERYAVCDSTGFVVEIARIARVEELSKDEQARIEERRLARLSQNF